MIDAVSCTIPSAAATSAAGTGSPGGTSLNCSGSTLGSVGTGVVLLGIAVLVAGLVAFAMVFVFRDTTDDDGHKVPIISLPYMTWFLIHFGIPALGILIIAGLAIAGSIDASVVSALLGSLFGYVLGASASRSTSQSSSKSADSVRQPSITGVYPTSVTKDAPSPVALFGANLSTAGMAPTVKFGGVAAETAHVADSSLLWVTPPKKDAAGAVPIEVSIKSQVISKAGLTFTYTDA